MTRATLLFAGGGTGGHVFPLLAVADAVRALDPELKLVFVGTRRGLEARWVPERGYELEFIDVRPMRGSGLGGVVAGARSAAAALPASFSLIGRHAPRAVFSVGGYAAGPLTLAAFLRGVKVALLEPNADIGVANRLVAPLVSRAYTAFPETARFFPPNAVLEAGVPIRAGFAPQRFALNGAPPKILVLGGSQGAKTLNVEVPRALALLGRSLQVVHQCGPAHEAATRELYAELGFGARARVVPFIDDMPEQLTRADLVVGRAGASAVSELCAVGRPSVLVPYPYAGDHQRFNAFSLERRGAARTVLAREASAEGLAKAVGELLDEPDVLRDMAARAKSLGRPDAAAAIARDFLQIAEVS